MLCFGSSSATSADSSRRLTSTIRNNINEDSNSLAIRSHQLINDEYGNYYQQSYYHNNHQHQHHYHHQQQLQKEQQDTAMAGTAVDNLKIVYY